MKEHLCNYLLLLQKFGNCKSVNKGFLAAVLRQGAIVAFRMAVTLIYTWVPFESPNGGCRRHNLRSTCCTWPLVYTDDQRSLFPFCSVEIPQIIEHCFGWKDVKSVVSHQLPSGRTSLCGAAHLALVQSGTVCGLLNTSITHQRPQKPAGCLWPLSLTVGGGLIYRVTCPIITISVAYRHNYPNRVLKWIKNNHSVIN